MSGLIPQPFIAELISRIDLVELIESYVPLKQSGNSWVACCPFHQEKTPSFNVIGKKQFYHCFGCGVSGNAISFLMNYLNQDFIEAIEALAARVGLTVPYENHTKIQQGFNLYQVLTEVSEYYQSLLKTSGQEAIAYLRQRGLNGETAKYFQIGYAPEGWQTLEKHFKNKRQELLATGMLIQKENGQTYDRYRQRIMFPIHDKQGRIIGFGGRSLLPEQQPKYLNSPETQLFKKNRELYGLHQVLKKKGVINQIIIVEGYLDVLALVQFGILNAVATLGTATSTYHIQLLSRYCKQLIFCFDGDKAGRQAAWRALESCLPHLNTGLDVRFVFLPENHDPDSFVRNFGKDAFDSYLEKAVPFHRYFFDNLTSGIQLQYPAGKSQLVEAAKPLLKEVPDGSYKQLLVDELSRITHLENHRLQLLINKDKSETIPVNNPKKINRSPIRIAIALLLQNPEIFSDCPVDEINFDLLDKQDQKILCELISQIKTNPRITTAALVENWRNNPLFESINRLASWDHQVPENALSKEFIDIIFFLQKRNLEDKINLYIAKSRKEGLTVSERIQLQNLLKQRHKTMDDKV